MTATQKSELARKTAPFIPLILGQGKLARHFSYYLKSLNISFLVWPNARDLTNPAILPLLSHASCAWLMISDRALVEVSLKIRELSPDLLQIHSSAATSVPGALTLHPLQTFGPAIHWDSPYSDFPFMLIQEEWTPSEAKTLRSTLEKIFPNPFFEIPGSVRGLYHAYCVMMANFPQLLWSRIEEESAQFLTNPRELFAPILQRATENFIAEGKAALTGPLIRGDIQTLRAHEKALQASHLSAIYQKFSETFQSESQKEPL